MKLMNALTGLALGFGLMASTALALAALILTHPAWALPIVPFAAVASATLAPAAAVLMTASILLAGLSALMAAMSLVGPGLSDGGRRPRQAKGGAAAHKNCVQAHVETSHRPASWGRPGGDHQVVGRSGH